MASWHNHVATLHAGTRHTHPALKEIHCQPTHAAETYLNSYNLVPYCRKPRPTHLVPNNALSTYCVQPQDIHMSGDNLSFNLLHTTTRHACYISIRRADLHVVSVHCIQIYPCLLSVPHPNKTTRVVKVFPELILQPSQDTACAGALFYSLTLSYHVILWWVHPDLPSD